MPALLVAHRRPGFYLRVLEEGDVGAGDAIEVVHHDADAMSVAAIDGLLYLPGHARRDLERALRITALSEGWRGSFREMLSSSSATTAAPAWQGLRRMRVGALERESDSVISVQLVPLDGASSAAPLPGQFITVRLRPDPATPPLVRTYSLSSAPSAANYRISVKREPHGAASGYVHTALCVGDVLEAGAPRGTFVLRPPERPVVLISAGVGATPVLAMLHALVDPPTLQQVWWVHAARNASEQPFAAEASALLGQLAHAHRLVCFSRPGPDDRDFDVAGRLTLDVLEQAGVPLVADFYVCGPPAFMLDLRAALVARGVAPERINSELFGPADSITPGIAAAPARPPHPPPGPPGTGPSVAFARSNLTVRWDPSFASLLELAEACDVQVRCACRTGVCHTCETGLVAGDVRYRPDPLEPPAPGAVLLCCAQPVGEVALDL